MTMCNEKLCRSRRWTLIACVLIGLCILFAAGCGESDDLKIDQAKIALANNKPDRALLLADSVLANDPSNFEALLIQAQSQIAMNRLAPAKLTLDRLTRQQPDDPRTAESLLDWSIQTIDSVLENSAFAITRVDQQSYELAQSVAHTQLQILRKQDGNEAAVLFAQAKLAYGDLRHARIMKAHTQRMIEKLGPDAAVEGPQPSVTAPESEPQEAGLTFSQALATYEQAEVDALEQTLSGLEAVLKTEPGNDEASSLFLRIAAGESRWARLLAQARRFAEVKDLPVPIAERTISMLLGVPDDVASMDEKVALGEAMLRATPADQSESEGRKISSARLLLATRQTDKALPILSALIESGTQDADAYVLYSHALYEAGDYAKCREIVERMMPQMSSVSGVQTLYGLTLWRLGELSKARDALREACRLDPNNTLAVDAFASLMAQQGLIGASGEDVDAFYQLDPNNPRAIQFKLQHAAASGDPQQAASILEELESQTQHTPEELALLYSANTMLARHHAAEQWARKLIETRPQDMDAWMQLAAAQLRQNDEHGLDQTLKTISQRFADAPGPAQLKAEVYLQTQQYERAAAALQMALESDPGNTKARTSLARAMAAIGRFNSALDEVKRVLESEPDNIQALALGARITSTRGDQAQADAYLNKIDPDHAEVQRDPALLAQVHVSRGELDKAEEVCTRAIAAGNASPLLRLVLADLYQKRGEPQRAEEHLVALVRHYPNSAEAFAWLGQFYAGQGNVDQGVQKLKGVEIYNQTLAVLAQAGLLRSADRLDDAINLLDPLLDRLINKRDPASQTVADAMAQLYQQKGDNLAAEAIYDRLYRQQAAGTSELLGEVMSTWDSDTPAQRLVKLDAVTASVPPDDTITVVELSRRYAMLGRPEKSMSLVQRGLIQDPKNLELLGVKAGVLVMMGRADEAIETYRQALAIAPQDESLRVRYARALSSEGLRPEAEEELMRLIREGGGAALTARSALLEVYLSLGLYERAIDSVMAILDKLPAAEEPALDLVIGRVLMHADRHAEAQHRLASISDDSPYYAAARVYYARSQATSGDPAVAQAEVRGLVTDPGYSRRVIPILLGMNPQDQVDRTLLISADEVVDPLQMPFDQTESWLTLRLRLCDLTGDWTRAQQTLQQIAKMNDADEVKALHIAVMYQLDDKSSAAKLLHRSPVLEGSATGSLIALALGTEASKAGRMHPMVGVLTALDRGDRAMLESVMGEYDGMRTLFLDDLLVSIGQGVKADESRRAAFRDLAMATVAMEGRMPGLAVALCESASRKTPDSLPAYALLAGAKIELGEDAATLVDPAQRIVRGGSLPLMLNLVAQTAAKDHTNAIVSLRELTTRHPDNPYLKYQLAQELGAAGQSEEASAIYQPIAEQPGPYQMAAKNDLAYLYAKQGGESLDAAIGLAREVLQAVPTSPAVMDTTGWIEHLRGQNESALKLLTKSIASLSDMPEAHYHLGAVYQALDEDRWARYHLEQAAAGAEGEPGVVEARGLLKKLGEDIALP